MFPQGMFPHACSFLTLEDLWHWMLVDRARFRAMSLRTVMGRYKDLPEDVRVDLSTLTQQLERNMVFEPGPRRMLALMLRPSRCEFCRAEDKETRMNVYGTRACATCLRTRLSAVSDRDSMLLNPLCMSWQASDDDDTLVWSRDYCPGGVPVGPRLTIESWRSGNLQAPNQEDPRRFRRWIAEPEVALRPCALGAGPTVADSIVREAAKLSGGHSQPQHLLSAFRNHCFHGPLAQTGFAPGDPASWMKLERLVQDIWTGGKRSSSWLEFQSECLHKTQQFVTAVRSIH